MQNSAKGQKDHKIRLFLGFRGGYVDIFIFKIIHDTL